jgi:oxygen-dependent protoporphyrinogen oxidase
MRHTVWTHAIPQYALGYDAVIDAIERIEEQFPGWYMAGNYYGGVSVGDAAQSGDDAAARCISTMLS